MLWGIAPETSSENEEIQNEVKRLEMIDKLKIRNNLLNE